MRRKQDYEAWGHGLRKIKRLPLYALRDPNETACQAVVRAIARATGLQVLVCRFDASEFAGETTNVIANQYQLTLGRSNRWGSSDVEASIWISVPTDTKAAN